MTNPEDSSVMDTSGEMDLSNGPDMTSSELKILTAEEKKKFTEKYRKNYEALKNMDLEDGEFSESVIQMKTHVDKQNQVLEEVGVNELLTHDAKCIALSSEMSLNLVRKFNTESKFDKREFIQRLRQRALNTSRQFGVPANRSQGGSTRWIRFDQLFGIGLAYNKVQHQVPMMLRSFIEPEEKPDKKTAVRTKSAKVQSLMTQPEKVDSTNMTNEEDESEKRLRTIHNSLLKLQKRNPSIPLIQGSVNPNSFSTTVENFFNMAFLARQKLIKIENGDEENDFEPLVKALPNPANQEEGAEEIAQEEPEENQQMVQSVLTLDFETYEALITNLEITRAALK